MLVQLSKISEKAVALSLYSVMSLFLEKLPCFGLQEMGDIGGGWGKEKTGNFSREKQLSQESIMSVCVCFYFFSNGLHNFYDQLFHL